MKTRALILCVSLLFAVSCSKKKTTVKPAADISAEVLEGKAPISETQAKVEAQKNLDSSQSESDQEHSASIESTVMTTESNITTERMTVQEISEKVMTQSEVQNQEAPVEAIRYSAEGIAYVDPYWEKMWLDTHAKGGTARTMVLENREHVSDELSEVLVVRTNATPDVVTVELKAARMLKKMQMTFDDYVDYLSWEAGDCKEAFDSIYNFAEAYKFQLNQTYFSYSSDCNCNRINTEYTHEVLELFRYQRSSGWECPDNYITFKTCMDPTGDLNKYEKIKLTFTKANTLSEGDYEVYRIKIKQKRLGSKKLEFEVTPLISNGNLQLETEYNVKRAGLRLNRNSVSIKSK